MLAVDFDRLEHGRQAGGGEQDVGCNLAVAEYATVAGADVCGADKQLDRRPPDPLEVDAFCEDLPQGLNPCGFRS